MRRQWPGYVENRHFQSSNCNQGQNSKMILNWNWNLFYLLEDFQMEFSRYSCQCVSHKNRWIKPDKMKRCLIKIATSHKLREIIYQIYRIDWSLKIRFVHRHEIQIAFFWAASEVMPHQIIQNTLRHAFRSQISRIKRLISPFDPTGLCRTAVHQAQGSDLIGIRETKTNENVCASTDSKSDDSFQAEMRHHEEDLICQLVHSRIDKTTIRKWLEYYQLSEITN